MGPNCARWQNSTRWRSPKMSAYVMIPMAIRPPPRNRSRPRPSIENTAPVISDFGKMSPGAERRFFEGIKIWLARGADDAGHQHPAGAGIASVLNQRRNGPLRAAALVLVPVMNEAEIRRVGIGAIAVPQSLVGRRRLPSREYGGGNGVSGSRERQERGRVIKPMLSLPARGFVPASGRCRPISFTSARRARRLIGDGPVLSGSIGTVVDGF